MSLTPTKRKIVTVNLDTQEPFEELMLALSAPKAKIISEVGTSNRIVYIIEYV